MFNKDNTMVVENIDCITSDLGDLKRLINKMIILVLVILVRILFFLKIRILKFLELTISCRN